LKGSTSDLFETSQKLKTSVKRIEDLQVERDKLNQDLAQFKAKIFELDGMLQGGNLVLKQKDLVIEEGLAEIIKIRKKAVDTAEIIKQMEQSVSIKESKIAEQENLIMELKSSTSIQESKYQGLLSMKEKLDKKLTDTISKQKKADSLLQNAHSGKSEVEKRVKEFLKEIAFLQARVSQLEKEKKELTAQADADEFTILQGSKEAKKLRDSLAELEASLVSSQRKAVDLAKEVQLNDQNYKITIEKDKKDYQDAMNSLQTDMQSKTKYFESTIQKLKSDYNQELRQLSLDKKSLLRERDAKIDAELNTKISNLTKEKDNLLTENIKLAEKSSFFERQLDSLNKSMDVSSQKFQLELISKDKEIAYTSNELGRMQGQLNNTLQQIQSLNHEKSYLQSEVSLMYEQVQRAVRDREMYEMNLAHFQHSKAASDVEFRQMQKDLAEKTIQGARSESLLNIQNEKLKQVEHANMGLKDEISALKQKIESHEQSLKYATEARDALLDLNGKSGISIRSANEKYQVEVMQNENLKLQIHNLQLLIDKNEHESKILSESFNVYKNQIKMMESDIEDKDGRIQKFESEIQVAENSIKEKQKRIDELTCSLDQLRESQKVSQASLTLHFESMANEMKSGFDEEFSKMTNQSKLERDEILANAKQEHKILNSRHAEEYGKIVTERLALEEKIITLKSERKDLKDCILRFESSLALLNTEIAEEKSKNETHAKKIKRYEKDKTELINNVKIYTKNSQEQRDKLTELEQQNRSMEMQLERLTANNLILQKAIDEKEVQVLNISHIQTTCQTLSEEKGEMHLQIIECNVKIKFLTNELISSYKTLSSIGKVLDVEYVIDSTRLVNILTDKVNRQRFGHYQKLQVKLNNEFLDGIKAAKSKQEAIAKNLETHIAELNRSIIEIKEIQREAENALKEESEIQSLIKAKEAADFETRNQELTKVNESLHDKLALSNRSLSELRSKRDELDRRYIAEVEKFKNYEISLRKCNEMLQTELKFAKERLNDQEMALQSNIQVQKQQKAELQTISDQKHLLHKKLETVSQRNFKMSILLKTTTNNCKAITKELLKCQEQLQTRKTTGFDKFMMQMSQ
jgi:chromosome segregation ATPase